MNTTTDSQLTIALARVLQAKPGQDLTQRAVEVMAQLKAAQAKSQPVANNDENWATLQLLAIAKTLGLPADKKLADLPAFTVALMGSRR